MPMIVSIKFILLLLFPQLGSFFRLKLPVRSLDTYLSSSHAEHCTAILSLPSLSLPFPPYTRQQIPSKSVTLVTLEDYRFQLLSQEDVPQAAALVAQAHFQPHTHPASLHPFQAVLLPFYETWNRFLLHNLNQQIQTGFVYRSPTRLETPSIDYSDESIIIVVKLLNSEEVIGLVEAYPTNPSYVCNLSVDPRYRGRGLGKLLCQVCEDFLARQWKIRSVYLHVDRKNLIAQKLYESLDYRVSDNPIVYQTAANLYFPKRIYVEYVKKLTDLKEGEGEKGDDIVVGQG